VGLLYKRKEDLQRSLVKKHRIVHLAEVFSDLHHHRQAYVDDNGRSQGDEGTVNEE